MYINPNSTIKLLKNVPLDNTYDHTIYFTSSNQQYTYFNSFTKYTFDNQYYQRVNRGYLRIKRKADDLYDCNYLMFRNTAYGDKWFYAFVSSVEYINDSVTEIQFEIDVMQTWYFNYTLGQSFVEREHAASDAVGENLVPENLPTGEIMYAGESVILRHNHNDVGGTNRELCVVVAAPFDKQGVSAAGGEASYLYSGVKFNVFIDQPNSTIIDQLNSFFNSILVAPKAEQVVTAFYYFKDFAVNPNTDTPITGLYSEDFSFRPDWSGYKNNYLDPNEELYIPHNNKLLTAPYNYFTITDFSGSSMDYMYEFFDHHTFDDCKFKIIGGLSTTPAIAIVPQNYMGFGSLATSSNFDYAFWYSNFPKIAWNSDGFIAWLAQTAVGMAGKITGDVISSGYLGALGGAISHNIVATSPEVWKASQARIILDTPASVAQANSGKYPEYHPNLASPPPDPTGLSGSVGNVMASGAIAALKGRVAHGNNSYAPDWYCNNIRVSVIQKKIRKEWAEKIDSYFDRFGYATMMTKVPNRHVRERWTYTKTLGCVLATSNLPADDAKKICAIYDHGITFWVSTATVGDYSRSNEPLA